MTNLDLIVIVGTRPLGYSKQQSYGQSIASRESKSPSRVLIESPNRCGSEAKHSTADFKVKDDTGSLIDLVNNEEPHISMVNYEKRRKNMSQPKNVLDFSFNNRHLYNDDDMHEALIRKPKSARDINYQSERDFKQIFNKPSQCANRHVIIERDHLNKNKSKSLREIKVNRSNDVLFVKQDKPVTLHYVSLQKKPVSRSSKFNNYYKDVAAPETNKKLSQYRSDRYFALKSEIDKNQKGNKVIRVSEQEIVQEIYSSRGADRRDGRVEIYDRYMRSMMSKE